jgi:uncharacterized membrane protein YphA (DoxX/SURF4 family)
MTRTKKIIYWIATLWLSLGMTSTGIVQLFRLQPEVETMMSHLGYPSYLLTILGVWKILGVVAVLIPRFPLLKEWAYAGFSSRCPELLFHISRWAIHSTRRFRRCCF